MSKHRYDNENRTGPFNYANAKFTMNRSMHGIVETAVSCQDHIRLNRIDPVKTYAYQDIAMTMKAYEKYEVLTFDFLYALFDLSSIPTSLFQLQYTLRPFERLLGISSNDAGVIRIPPFTFVVETVRTNTRTGRSSFRPFFAKRNSISLNFTATSTATATTTTTTKN
jgi:hypothetical protein